MFMRTSLFLALIISSLLCGCGRTEVEERSADGEKSSVRVIDWLGEAYSHTRYITAPSGKVNVLCAVAELQAAKGLPQDARKTLAEAHACVNAIDEKNKSQKYEPLCDIAESESKIGLKAESRKTLAEAAEIAKTSLGEYGRITRLLAKSGMFDEALAFLKEIDEELVPETFASDVVWLGVAEEMAKAGRVTDAKKFLADALASLAGGGGVNPGGEYIYIIETQANLGMTDETLKAARKVQCVDGRVGSICAVAKVYLKNGRKDDAAKLAKEALALVSKDDGRLDNAKCYCAIAELQALLGEKKSALETFNKAVAHARRVGEDGNCGCFESEGEMLTTITEKMAAVGFLDEAPKVALGINDDCWRFKALALAAEALHKAGRKTECMDLLIKAEELAAKSSETAWYTLYPIAKVEVKVAMWTRAIENAKKIYEPETAAEIFSDIAYALGRNGKTERLQTTYSSISDRPALVRAHFCLGAARGLMEQD